MSKTNNLKHGLQASEETLTDKEGKLKDSYYDGRTANEESREKIKMIHLLAKNGAKWFPKDRLEIGDARRSLLKMAPDYTAEFIWILSKYNDYKTEDIEELIRTSSIQSLISEYRSRIDEMMKDFSDVNTQVFS